jgi:hypothetical protein
MAKIDQLADTKRLMGALGRLPPKQHKDMKLGKAIGKRKARTVPEKRPKLRQT